MNSSFSSVCNPICEVSATTQFIKHHGSQFHELIVQVMIAY